MRGERGAKKGGGQKGGATKGGATKGGATKGGATKGSAKKGSAKKGSAKKGSAKKGSAKKGGDHTGGGAKKAVAPFPKGIIDDSRIYGTSDYSRLKTVKGTSFSSERPYHYYQIAKILRRLFRDPKLIIDACSHIGCSALNMATTYPAARVVGIEVKKSVYDALLLNVAASGLHRRVSIVHDNCIPYLKKLEGGVRPDFVNIDPPWGGPSYIRQKRMMLTLCNTAGRAVPIYEIILDLFERGVTEAVTFKAPVNFDMEVFVENVGKRGDLKVYAIHEGPEDRGVVYKFVAVRKAG